MCTSNKLPSNTVGPQTMQLELLVYSKALNANTAELIFQAEYKKHKVPH